MNRKILAVFLLVALVFFSGCPQEKPEIDEKLYCESVDDCVLSSRDPEGWATCVNKEWNEKWNQNPASKEFVWECLGTGTEQCGCIENKCQRIDSSKEC